MKRDILSVLLSIAALAPAGNAGGTINVEIDYMVTGTHSHMPSATDLAAVVQMFACQGWTLNVVVDDAIPEVPILRCTDLTDNFWSCLDPTSYRTIKDVWFDGGSEWHYCIFGHQYNGGSGTGSSGRADNADDFIVTLWNFSSQPNGSPFDRAGTFAHELGHNLGLGHNTPFSSGGGNYSPVYASVMSYQYQLDGVRTRIECLGLTDDTSKYKELDYSHGRLPTLFEYDLDEGIGVGIRSVDFDCDGGVDALPVTSDLESDDNWCTNSGSIGWVTDYDDWANIRDIPTGSFLVPPPHRDWSCVTLEEVERHRGKGGEEGAGTPCPAPTLATESCGSGLMIWVDPSASLPGSGTGSAPYASLSSALTSAPSSSVLYLQPGSQVVAAAPLVITKRLILAGPGGAVIDP